jgi:hypothetical protein
VEAGARALFDVTFGDTLPLHPTWEEQPDAFKDDFRFKAMVVATAAVADPEPQIDDSVDIHDEIDFGEPEGGD